MIAVGILVLVLAVFTLLAWRASVLGDRWIITCHTAGMSSREPVEDVLNEIARLKFTEQAAFVLYYAAYWTPDRECGAERLWTELHDAAKWTPGCSPKPMKKEVS